MSRFKVWSGNIGAHQRGKSSLDYRLRDASHLSTQVKTLLQDLKHALNNAFSILDGTKIPWDQELSGNESDDESISGPEDDDIEFATEMDQLLADIAGIVSCLLKLSVSIRNPAPHDRFRGSTKTDTSFYEPADIAHVQAKFGQANPNLVKLLGKANTRRRQFFKYRETHHQKLSRGLEMISTRARRYLRDKALRAKAKRLVAEESRERGGMPHQTTTLDLAPGSCTSSEDDSTSGRKMLGIVENSSEVAGEATTGSRQFENLERLREAISTIPQHVEGPPRRNSATSPDNLSALRQQRESSAGAAEANSSSDSGPSTLTNINQNLDDPETAQHAPTLLTKWDRFARGSTAVESSTLMEEFNVFWAKIKAQPDSYLMTQDEFNKYGTILWQFGDTKTVIAALDRYDQQTPSRPVDNLNPKHLVIDTTSPRSVQDLLMQDDIDPWELQNTVGDSISPWPDSRAATRFVGDLNPKHFFIEATSPHSARDLSVRGGVGVWESRDTSQVGAEERQYSLEESKSDGNTIKSDKEPDETFGGATLHRGKPSVMWPIADKDTNHEDETQRKSIGSEN
ncbi:hypothetical protein E8E14_010428 [Neopestalotiopsis sp. 37M]|nr:hypothetical protein E8E14_010428 [Neopestalotiopsis sp. 37M]